MAEGNKTFGSTVPTDASPKIADAQEILALLMPIFIDQLNVEEEEVLPDANFIDDLDADSLGMVSLVMDVEEAFQFDVPDEGLEKMKTVRNVVDYIADQYGVPHLEGADADEAVPEEE